MNSITHAQFANLYML